VCVAWMQSDHGKDDAGTPALPSVQPCADSLALLRQRTASGRSWSSGAFAAASSRASPDPCSRYACGRCGFVLMPLRTNASLQDIPATPQSAPPKGTGRMHQALALWLTTCCFHCADGGRRKVQLPQNKILVCTEWLTTCL
jgi:hypothetical protein